MAFANTYLQMASPGVPKLWLYKSADANAVAKASSYFDDINDQLTEGDIILSVLTTAGTVESTLMVVTGKSVVTTSDNITAT